MIPTDADRIVPGPAGTEPAKRPADGPPALRFDGVGPSAAAYGRDAWAKSTRLAYLRDWERFEAWCTERARPALPASPETVADFLAAEADRGLSPSTVARRVAAIRFVHFGAGEASPHAAFAVTRVLRGIRTRAAEAGRRVAGAEPLLDADIRTLVSAIGTDTPIGLRDRALILCGFDGAFRRSELARVRVADLEHRPTGIVVAIPYSKGDREGAGQEVGLLARPGSRYCPVAALGAWLEAADIRTGPVFRPVRRGGHVGPGALSGASIGNLVVGRLQQAGFGERRMSAHSLRHGLLTEAARDGADLFRIAAHSRHRNLETVRRYVHREETLSRHVGAGRLREDDR